MKGLHTIAFILLIIGGLNWLLEAFGTGLGHWGLPSALTMIVYVLVGLSALYEVFTHKSRCKACGSQMSSQM
ncbi:MAG: hypothetical protein A2741_01205 [Candidatus Zambryskibacteria bacterium RIFCSPHIGHO2_01_FULL_43_27]|uniref:DUF378 domain-containing protein n=1 Tax=Candidatus Zambryskibacteria bacterium RIFCSPLOWO2_01_FULL_43_17 TaxID=1802760 RepID=A0A1G2U1D0_9BACT|nr:MAG: hypothetical protein A2741_01205 [Candidatus Zambryskibacteria bacterium RIFCSPHIGHO2_01_FULL_43_27]OHA99871.1 MAG: hypothetical protein A3E93_02195 [Candidatus Zambryskibacteria bacterium RIFCSPHIGHO2_12_FULL_43_12b]OHB03307.1 MAG: hypothetical protein A2920_01060 [Candidatus Zambryskibacteria bacterium RIFCSPLOWO2_01_FULL_43_17]